MPLVLSPRLARAAQGAIHLPTRGSSWLKQNSAYHAVPPPPWPSLRRNEKGRSPVRSPGPVVLRPAVYWQLANAMRDTDTLNDPAPDSADEVDCKSDDVQSSAPVETLVAMASTSYVASGTVSLSVVPPADHAPIYAPLDGRSTSPSQLTSPNRSWWSCRWYRLSRGQTQSASLQKPPLPTATRDALSFFISILHCRPPYRDLARRRRTRATLHLHQATLHP